MSQADFDAALAAKVPALDDEGATETQEVTEEAEEVEEESPHAEAEIPEAEAEEAEAEVERSRDEKGRFVSERPEWLPQNFKNVEDYARSLEHKVETFDRQANELGELRQIVDSLKEPPAAPHDGGIREALEENPEGVARWAYENGNQQVLDVALTAMQQRAMDEGDALALRKAVNFEIAINNDRLMGQFKEQLLPPVEEFQKDSLRRSQAAAGRELISKYPDFQEVMESASEDPSLVEGFDFEMFGQLQKDNPVASGELLYRWIAGGRASKSVEDTRDREADLQRKREATVATSSSAPAERAKDAKELLKEFMLQPEPHSVHHGLTRE